jgi:deoxycytidylate deaminase
MRKFLFLLFIFSVFTASNVLATGGWQSCSGTGPIGSAASVCQDLVKNAGESYVYSHMDVIDDSSASCFAKYKNADGTFGSGSPDMVGSACKTSDGNASAIGSDSNTDQDMINNLVNERRDKNKSEDGNATFAQGRDGDGNLTPVRESIPGETRDKDVHAEPQVLSDLEGKPKPHTVAVDQVPCSGCTNVLMDKGVDKVVVPSKASNPNGSPKTAAKSAAEKGTKVTPREIKLDEKSKK